jgi:hypothetical protein
VHKFLGCQMMKNIEFYYQLVWKHYGSQAGKKVIGHALNKVLMFDLVRQSRRDVALCSNDVNSCYGSISHSVAAIAMQKQNFPGAACVCVFTTLQHIHHTIHTIYGDSKTGYGGTLWAVSYAGMVQGNGVGPGIWAVVSTPVLK